MGTRIAPHIVKDNLVLHLDAASQRSNLGYGIRWKDLSRYGNDAIFNNSGGLITTSSAINSTNDDTEEDMRGLLKYVGTINSTDLELGYEDETGGTSGSAGQNRVGLRFTGLQIPPKSAISSSYIQFTVDENGTTESPILRVVGELTGSSVAFAETANNLLNRNKTNTSVSWTDIPSWSGFIGSAGVDQRTPNLAPIIQEIVNQDTYTSSSAITVFIESLGTGTAKRTAEAFDGTAAPVLNVTYMPGPLYTSEFNGGIHFTTSSNQDARIADNTSVQFGSGSFTVEIVAQSNSTAGRGAIIWRDDGGGDLGWYLECRGTPTSDPPQIAQDLEDGIIVDNGMTGPNYTAGEVFHTILMRDGDDMKTFHNGQPFNSQSLTGLGDTDNPTSIFIGGASSYYNEVQVYLVRMYNRALSNAEVLQNYNATKSRFQDYFDTDTVAFINAVVTDGTSLTPIEQRAVDYLVRGFKLNGTWDKHNVIYPFVGATSGSHKYNLKDPQNSDSSYRILWSGSLVHSSLGVEFDGNGSYGETYYVPSGSVTLNSESIIFYSNTNNTPTRTDAIEVGAYNSSTQASFLSARATSGTLIRSRFNNSVISFANTDARGLFAVSKNGDTTARLFKNGNLLTSASIAGTLPTSTTHIGKLNLADYTNGYSNQRLTFVALSNGLSDSEMAADYTIIQGFQEMLKRSV